MVLIVIDNFIIIFIAVFLIISLSAVLSFIFGGTGPGKGRAGMVEFSKNEVSLRKFSFNLGLSSFGNRLTAEGPHRPRNDK